MKNLFTMGELMSCRPCKQGLDRLTSELGDYSDKTIITPDNLGPLTVSDLLRCLKLLPISEHEQKVNYVKVAVFAAELVSHLTEDPNDAACLAAAKNWLADPCKATKMAADAEMAEWAAAEWAAEAKRAVLDAVRAAAAGAAEWAAGEWAADVEWAVLDAVRAAERAVLDAEMAAAYAAADAVEAKIKAYLINLIKELD